MSPEEEAELRQERNLYAGIALPGIIMKQGLFHNHRDIAQEAFKIADAMIEESNKPLTPLESHASIH